MSHLTAICRNILSLSTFAHGLYIRIINIYMYEQDLHEKMVEF